MNSFYHAATVILSEITITLLVLSGIMIFTTVRNKRRKQNALAQLTEKIKQAEGGRLISLKAMLKDVYHYPDDKLDEISAGIIKTEMVFYQRLMDTFSSRKGAALESFDQNIVAIIDAYRNLVPHGDLTMARDNITHQNTDSLSLKNEMAHLTDKNETLARELDAIKAAMEETNSEFTRAFTGRMKKNAEAADENVTMPNTPEDMAKQPEVKPEPVLKAETAQKPELAESESGKDVFPESATAGSTTPQNKPVSPPEQAIDNDEDVLKNLDIDLGEITLGSGKAKGQKAATLPAEKENGTVTATAINTPDKKASIENPVEAAAKKSTPDIPQKNTKPALTAVKEKTG